MAHIELDELAKKGGVTRTVPALLAGHAESAIVKYAERERIDLIVLGTHGRSGLRRALMGSVAEAVLRTAPCQVLTIGPKVPVTEAPVAPPIVVAVSHRHCLVCARPSLQSICDTCKAQIQGEALERKRKEELAGHRGLPF
jgi:K+-sensing histidine kinase KdpD